MSKSTTFLLLLLSFGGTAAGQQPAPAQGRPSSYTVFLRSAPIGIEQIVVDRTADGWTITSSGRMGAPVDVVARSVQVKYTADWKPLELSIDALQQGQPFIRHTTISGTTASTTVAGQTVGETGQQVATIAADAILLPSPFWGPFEALSQRLRTAAAGSMLSTFNLQGSVPIAVGQSAQETIDVGNGAIHARRTTITLQVAGAPLDAEIWGDDEGHLVRVSIPRQNLEVVRDDVASVGARRVTISRAGDEQIRIPANGFTLAGTLSKPADTTSPPPAVVLVGGSGPTDRDETVFGIPIFGQIANALADAGFVVLRYDKRGVGQSGGRAESASITDFADDLRAALKFLAGRKDVDQKRIAAAGHSEGGLVAMLAADKDDRIAALVLIDTIGVTGAELNLYQVSHALAQSNKPEAEKQSTIELQKKIQQAVIAEKGWEGIPTELRRQADTPWFRSFLTFDPAKTISGTKQPILIVQSMLDTQVPADNADKLEALAKARKRNGGVDVVKVPGINHLLVPATTGEVSEYASLSDRQVSPAVATAISEWLKKTFGR